MHSGFRNRIQMVHFGIRYNASAQRFRAQVTDFKIAASKLVLSFQLPQLHMAARGCGRECLTHNATVDRNVAQYRLAGDCLIVQPTIERDVSFCAGTWRQMCEVFCVNSNLIYCRRQFDWNSPSPALAARRLTLRPSRPPNEHSTSLALHWTGNQDHRKRKGDRHTVYARSCRTASRHIALADW